jgi:hypothetical protein
MLEIAEAILLGEEIRKGQSMGSSEAKPDAAS